MLTDPFSPGFVLRLPAPPRKIALLRASRIGDFICATPAFKALRAAFPDAEMTLIALPFVEPLATRLPTLDRFVAFPGFPGTAEQFFEPRSAVRFFREMQREGFDLVVQMHGSGAYMNPFALLCGGRRTAGFTRDSRRSDLLDAALPFPPPPTHEIDRLLALTTFLGSPPVDDQPRLSLLAKDRREAADVLACCTKPIVALQPGAREARKQWALERFIETGKRLLERYSGTVIVLGGPDEAEPAEIICAGLGEGCINLAASLSLPVLAGVIEQVSLLITNDSGPAHMAYALGTPSITLFGGTDPRMWAGRNKQHVTLAHPISCRPCDQECQIGHRCLDAIAIDDVLDCAEDLLMRSERG